VTTDVDVEIGVAIEAEVELNTPEAVVAGPYTGRVGTTLELDATGISVDELTLGMLVVDSKIVKGDELVVDNGDAVTDVKVTTSYVVTSLLDVVTRPAVDELGISEVTTVEVLPYPTPIVELGVSGAAVDPKDGTELDSTKLDDIELDDIELDDTLDW